MNRTSLRPLFIAVAAAAFILGLLWLAPAKLMDGYDLARMHQCYKSDLRSALLAGEMPWWNPFTALGRPFLADVETASLYPPSWLVLPCGVTTGILLIIGLHLALAIEGTRRLGEQLGLGRTFALVAGVSFALSGALLGRIQAGQLQVFCVLCLWPWLWWAGWRLQDEPGGKAIVRFAGVLALSFLAGSPPILWCGLVVLGALLLARSSTIKGLATLAIRLAAAGALAAGLAAVQLLPFIELVQQGNRQLDDVYFATRAGITGSGWLTLLVPPGIWSPPDLDGEYNLHGGALFLVFACTAMAGAFRQRNIRALAAAALLSVVLALGDKTFVLPGLAEWVPGFASVRYPSRYALGCTLVVALLAAWWLDRAWREKRLSRSTVTFSICLQGLVLMAGLLVQGEFYHVPVAPANESHLQADLREAGLPRDGAPPRVALPASILRADAGAQCGVSTLTGFNSPALARTWTTLYLLAGQSPPDYHRAEVRDEIILQLGEQKRYFGLSAVFTLPGYEVHFSPPPVPRAFLSFAARRVTGWREAVEKIRDGHDFVQEALVEQEVTLAGHETAPGGRAQIVSFSRNRIVTEYHAPIPGLLVLAEAWYPGWTARLEDATPLAVLPVNGWMRGIHVPAGTHRVVLEYRPTWWWTGAGLSLLCSLLALLLWRWRPTDSPPVSPR